MALGRAFSVAVRGLDGIIVEIEADITGGLPGFQLIGLPDAAVQESRDRVRAAISNAGNPWPMSRLTVALSPATLPTAGSLYDVALACAVMAAGRKKPWHRLERGLRLNRLRAFTEGLASVRGLKPTEQENLLTLLTKALDKKLLNSKTAVLYDAEKEEITEIKPLVMHQNASGEILFQILERRNAVTFRKKNSTGGGEETTA